MRRRRLIVLSAVLLLGAALAYLWRSPPPPAPGYVYEVPPLPVNFQGPHRWRGRDGRLYVCENFMYFAARRATFLEEVREIVRERVGF